MDLFTIMNEAINTEYKYGKNDCNIVSLKVLDLRAGTDYASQANYTTAKGGIKQIQSLGFLTTGELIKSYADQVTHYIDGDIWISTDNPLMMGVVFSNRLLGVNTEHNKFTLIPITNEGEYYRIRKL